MAGSRKTDTQFAGLMEEQRAAQPETAPATSTEVRGRMNHQPMTTEAPQQQAARTDAAKASAPAVAAPTAPATPAPAGIPLNGAERRARRQAAQTAQASQTAQAAQVAQGKKQPAVSDADPNWLASLMGETNPRNLGHLLGQSSQAVRAVLTGEQPKGIALPSRRGGIALDASMQQQLARAHSGNRTEAALRASHMTNSTSVRNTKPKDLGKLAAQFESGSDGVSAIGYDRNGGTSYGKYQIASRPGTMARFIEFLQDEAPDMSQRLTAAGPANTGSRAGTMPNVWRELATEQPERFEKLQEKFIHESHYLPARSAISQHGYQTEKLSPAMQEVLFSTAVQHGPAGASRIFAQAADRVGLSPATQQKQEQQLIKEIYTLRAEQFGSSTPQVQTAVRRRMDQEQQLAMNMSRQKPVAA